MIVYAIARVQRGWGEEGVERHPSVAEEEEEEEEEEEGAEEEEEADSGYTCHSRNRGP